MSTTRRASLVGLALVVVIGLLAVVDGVDPGLVAGTASLGCVAVGAVGLGLPRQRPHLLARLLPIPVIGLGVADLVAGVGSAGLPLVAIHVATIVALGLMLHRVGGWREVAAGAGDGLALGAATMLILWAPVLLPSGDGPPLRLASEALILGAALRIVLIRGRDAPAVAGALVTALVAHAAAGVALVLADDPRVAGVLYVLSRCTAVAAAVLPGAERLLASDGSARSLGRLGVSVASLMVLGVGAGLVVAEVTDEPLVWLAPMLIVLLAIGRALRNHRLQQRLRGELARALVTDEPTGLRNERWARDRLASAGQHPAVLLALVDATALRTTMSAGEFDLLVLAVAERAAAAGRTILPPARVDRGEVLLLLDDDADTALAAERVAAAFAVAVDTAGGPLRLAVTVAHGRVGGVDALADLSIASAMATQLGVGGVTEVSDELTLAAHRTSRLRHGLRGAAERGELDLRWMPIVDLRTGRLAGAEALLRWRRTAFEVVGPDEFIPLAEVSGAIVALGSWVLEEACAQLEAVAAQADAGFWISVNVSARQLEDDAFVDEVVDAVERHGLQPGRLTVEVTEHVVARDPDRAIERLRELARRGVHVAIDDFGTGYSSLSYLSRMPVHVVKVDAAFTPTTDGQHADADLAAGIYRLVGSVARTVVAEGLETVDQRDGVHDLGATHGQGYLFGRPSGLAELVRRARVQA